MSRYMVVADHAGVTSARASSTMRTFKEANALAIAAAQKTTGKKTRVVSIASNDQPAEVIVTYVMKISGAPLEVTIGDAFAWLRS